MPSKKIGVLSAELVLDIEGFLKPIKEAQLQSKEFEKLIKPGIKAVEDLGQSMVVTGGIVTAAMLAMVKSSANLGEQLNKASIQTGITTEKLSALKFMADQEETSFENLSKGLKTMSASADKGSDAFGRLGVSTLDANGNLRPMDAILVNVAQRMALMEDGTSKNAIASEIFGGKLGQDLIPMLNRLGKEGLAPATEEATKLHLIMSGDAARSADTFNDTIKKLEDSVQGLSHEIASALTPALTKYADMVKDDIELAASFAEDNQGLTKAIFGTAAAITGAGGLLLGLAGVGSLIPKIVDGFALIKTAAIAMGATLSTIIPVAQFAALGVWFEKIVEKEADVKKTSEQVAASQTKAVEETFKNIKVLASLGIQIDQVDKSWQQVTAEVEKLMILNRDKLPPSIQAVAALQIKTAAEAAEQKKNETEAIKEQAKIETAYQAALKENYDKRIEAAGKFIQAWLEGFRVTSEAADKHTEAIQRNEVATSKLGLTAMDVLGAIQQETYRTGTAYDNLAIAELTSLKSTNDEMMRAATERGDNLVKESKKASDAQIKEQERYRDAFVASIANLNTRIAESFADMIVHAKFNMDSLISIAQDTASKMLSAFLSGLLSPLTSALANVGKSLGTTLFGATGGSGGILSGVLGGLTGGGSAAASTAGLTAAGFTADAAIPGTGGLAALGGILTNPITLGIGAAVAGVIAWVKSQAHWEANDLVQNFQNPFDAQVAGLVSQIVNNQDALSSADVRGAYTQIHDLWQSTIDTVQNWAAGSSDKGTVASQFFGTEVPVMQGLFDWLGSLDAGKRAVGLATGTPYVPYDNFPAMLHKGEAVVPAAQNPWAGGSSGLTVNINMESGAVFDEGIFRSKVLPMLELVLKNNTSGIAATTTLAVKHNWNSVVMA